MARGQPVAHGQELRIVGIAKTRVGDHEPGLIHKFEDDLFFRHDICLSLLLEALEGLLHGLF